MRLVSQLHDAMDAKIKDLREVYREPRQWLLVAQSALRKGDLAFQEEKYEEAYQSYYLASQIMVNVLAEFKIPVKDPEYESARARIREAMERMNYITKNYDGREVRIPGSKAVSEDKTSMEALQRKFQGLAPTQQPSIRNEYSHVQDTKGAGSGTSSEGNKVDIQEVSTAVLHGWFGKNLTKILVFDLRPLEDYINGHLSWTTSNKTPSLEGGVINLEPTYINQRTTIEELEHLCGFGSSTDTQKQLFKKRNDMKVILVYDANSKYSKKSSALFEYIYQALYMTPNVPPPKAKFFVLSGGYQGWIDFLKLSNLSIKDWTETGEGIGIKLYREPQNLKPGSNSTTPISTPTQGFKQLHQSVQHQNVQSNYQINQSVGQPYQSLNARPSSGANTPLNNISPASSPQIRQPYKYFFLTSSTYQSQSQSRVNTYFDSVAKQKQFDDPFFMISNNSIGQNGFQSRYPALNGGVSSPSYNMPVGSPGTYNAGVNSVGVYSSTMNSNGMYSSTMNNVGMNTSAMNNAGMYTSNGNNGGMYNTSMNSSGMYNTSMNNAGMYKTGLNNTSMNNSNISNMPMTSGQFNTTMNTNSVMNNTGSFNPAQISKSQGLSDPLIALPKPTKIDEYSQALAKYPEIVYENVTYPSLQSRPSSPNPYQTNSPSYQQKMSTSNSQLNPTRVTPSMPQSSANVSYNSTTSYPPVPMKSPHRPDSYIPVASVQPNIPPKPMEKPKELQAPTIPPMSNMYSSPSSMPTIKDVPPVPPKRVPSGMQPPMLRTSSLERLNSRNSLRRDSPVLIQGQNPMLLPSSPIQAPFGLSGLKNLGNTCFMNSTIQCLSATVPLARYFQGGSYRRHISKSNPLSSQGRVAESYASLIHSMWSGDEAIVNPSQFKAVIGSRHDSFAGYEQQDSQEFLSFILDQLHEDLNVAKRMKTDKEPDLDSENYPELEFMRMETSKYRNRNWSIIVDMFQGILKSVLQCLTCGKTSTTYNQFQYLSLPIPSINSAGVRNGPVTVKECLEQFLEREVLRGEDGWNCPRCKKRRDSTKKLYIVKLPTVLLIHFKRFSFEGPFRNKLETFVDFPITDLDMNPYFQPLEPSPPQVYNLYGVSNHFGGLSGGHYTAMVKHQHQNNWYNLDDSRVSECKVSEIKSPAAYILFYMRFHSNDMKDWWKGTPEV